MGLLSTILESVPSAPGPPMSPYYVGSGIGTASPQCSLDAPPPAGTGPPGPEATGNEDGRRGQFFGAKAEDYVSVKLLERMGDAYWEDPGIGRALALMVLLPVMAPVVVIEDTLRNPFPGITLRAPSGCPHG